MWPTLSASLSARRVDSPANMTRSLRPLRHRQSDRRKEKKKKKKKKKYVKLDSSGVCACVRLTRRAHSGRGPGSVVDRASGRSGGGGGSGRRRTRCSGEAAALIVRHAVQSEPGSDSAVQSLFSRRSLDTRHLMKEGHCRRRVRLRQDVDHQAIHRRLLHAQLQAHDRRRLCRQDVRVGRHEPDQSAAVGCVVSAAPLAVALASPRRCADIAGHERFGTMTRVYYKCVVLARVFVRSLADTRAAADTRLRL